MMNGGINLLEVCETCIPVTNSGHLSELSALLSDLKISWEMPHQFKAKMKIVEPPSWRHERSTQSKGLIYLLSLCMDQVHARCHHSHSVLWRRITYFHLLTARCFSRRNAAIEFPTRAANCLKIQTCRRHCRPQWIASIFCRSKEKYTP